MSLWGILEGGHIFPADDTKGRRLSARIGTALAGRRKGVVLADGVRISPDARLNARGLTIRIGRDSAVGMNAMIQGQVTLGERCSVQPGTLIVGYKNGPVTIGSDVRIAAYCMIIGANHRFDDPDRPIRTQGMDEKPIVIEDDVWIAGRVSIMAGVRVGRGSVLGAGCVVTRDVPPMSVMAGVPARCIRRRGDREGMPRHK